MILIAGPCVVENKDVLKQSVESILEAIEGKDINFIFKSSFMKDNRTKYSNFHGLEIDESLRLLGEIKKEYGVKICSDVHTTEHLLLDEVIETIDMIQIPAYLAKQQSFLHAAVAHCVLYKKTLHIKKPQFISPEDLINVVNNAKEWGAKDIILTDRGTQLGYDKVFMDPRHINIMKVSQTSPSWKGHIRQKVLWDITHPNKNFMWNKFTHNNKHHIESLGMAAIAAKADGLFLETHPDCRTALCDGATMLDNKKLKGMIEKFYRLWEFIDELDK